MSFKSWLKKLFSSEDKQQEKKQINIEQLPQIMEEEAKKLDEKQEEIKQQIRQEVLNSIAQIKEQIQALRTINLDKRKEEQKIKLIVQENLKVYLAYLERLTTELKNAQEKQLKNYITKINAIINNFQKLSKQSYEKATILIGEDIGKTRELVRNLGSKINNIISKNPELAKIEKLNEIKGKLELIEKIKNINLELDNRIIDKKKKQEGMESRKKSSEEEIEKLKQSEEYKKAQKDGQEKEKELEKLKQQVYSLKEQVDFKLLMNIFHSDERKKKLINNYNDNFLQALQDDENLAINELIKQAKPELNLNLEEIREKKKELEQRMMSEIEQELEKKLEEIKKIDEEKLTIIKEIEENKKKKVKLEEKNNQFLSEIKEKTSNLDIKLI